jgi:hypothetical protein
MPRPLSLLLPGACLALGLGAALYASPAQAQSEALYTLETTCSLRGGAAQPCVVEAFEEENFTTYRHRIGNATETIRIADNPVRMGRLDPATKSWSYLSSAAVQFSTNTICFNGTDLCVVNPNYLNSIREEKPEAMDGRDLVRVLFAENGRVKLACYDEGCEELQ